MAPGKHTYIYEIKELISGSVVDRLFFCEESEEEANVSVDFAIDVQYPDRHMTRELVDVQDGCENIPDNGKTL